MATTSFAQTTSDPTSIGDVVSYTLSISEELIDVIGVGFVLNYDADVLTLVDVTFESGLIPFQEPVTPVEADGPQALPIAGGAFVPPPGGASLFTLDFEVRAQGATTVSLAENGLDPFLLRSSGVEAPLPEALDFTFQILPDAVDDSAAVAEEGSVSVAVLANDVDEGDTLSIAAFSQGANGSVTLDGDALVYNPNDDFSGVDTFTYTVEDSFGAADTATVTVEVIGDNDAPVANDDAATTAEDTPVEIDVLANDADADGDALAVTVGAVANGSVEEDGGVLTFTPDQDFFGVATIAYTVSDGVESDDATVAITVTPVNDAPVAVDDAASTDEDVALQIAAAELLANDADAEGDDLSIISVGAAVNGAVALADGVVTFTPDANFNGDASFAYTVSDGNGGTDAATVSVEVISDNDGPVANDDFAFVDAGGSVEIDALANDFEPEGEPLTIVGAGEAANGAVSFTADGVVTYTPDAGFTGADSFTYAISDGVETVEGVIDVNVNGVVLEQINAGSVGLGGFVEVELRTLEGFSPFNGFSANLVYDEAVLSYQGVTFADPLDGFAPDPADEPDDGLIENILAFFFDFGDPTASLEGALTLATFSFEAIGQGDTAVQVVEATESDGGFFQNLDGEVVFNGSASATVVTNALPVTDDETLSVAEDGSETITFAELLEGDSDPDGDTLTVAAVGEAANGTVTVENGVVTYAPDADFNGEDSFTYTVDDGNGGQATGTVSVTVTAVNDAPEAADDAVSTDEDVPVTFAVLGNDDDVDGDTLTVTAVGAAANGAVVVNGDGTLTYTPDANFNGSDSFTYTIADGDGLTSTATVTVDIAPVNDGPVAVDDAVATDEDVPVTFAVLGNDSDVDGDALTVSGVGDAENGVVVVNEDGTLTYTAADDFFGTDSFTYTVIDGNGGEATATVDVTVDAVNDAPVFDVAPAAEIDVVEGFEGNIFDPAVGASDVDGDAVAFSLGGADASFFDIDAETGAVSLGEGAASELDDAPFSERVFDISVIASDGSLSDERAVAVTLLRDSDGDGFEDVADNAVLVANGPDDDTPSQRDSDGDGRGNVIDADFDNNGFVGFSDFLFFVGAFGEDGLVDGDDAAAKADFDGDGDVGLPDFGAFLSLFGQPVGLSSIDFDASV